MTGANRCDPLQKAHEAVGDNLVPQGPTFHWRNGWMFARGERLDVHIWNVERGIDLVIPVHEWTILSDWLKGWPDVFEVKKAT